MYATEVSYGVSSSKNIIPMFSKIPRHWLIRFVIGCGQFWLLPRTTEEKNDLDAQRNQAGGAFRVCRQHEAMKSRDQRGICNMALPERFEVAAFWFVAEGPEIPNALSSVAYGQANSEI